MDEIRVVLADAHQIQRAGVEAILADEPTIQLVGQASNGREFLSLMQTTSTDVVLLNPNMPELIGLQMAAYLTLHYPEVKILLLSMAFNEEMVEQMMSAGATGYLTKSSSRAELIHAIQTVAAGKPYRDSEVSLNVSQGSTPQAVQLWDGPGHTPIEITKREMEVLSLISYGYSNQEIAHQLGVSKRTVDSHRQNLRNKTQAKTTAALIKFAVSRGMID